MAGKGIMLEQDAPSVEKPYFLAPVGMYLNRELRRARPGTVVVFSRGWRRERRRLVRVCTLRVSSAAFTFMMRSLYGEDATISGLMERWTDESVLSGHGRNGVDPDVCLLGEVEPID